MKTLDKNNYGFVDLEEFGAGLKSLNIFCSKQEEHILLKKFDANGDGKISMEEFYNALASSFWANLFGILFYSTLKNKYF